MRIEYSDISGDEFSWEGAQAEEDFRQFVRAHVLENLYLDDLVQLINQNNCMSARITRQ